VTETLTPALFDPLAPEFLADPYPLYRRLRQHPAAVIPNGPAQWVAARYRPVAALLKDPRLGNEYPAQLQQRKLGDGDAADFVLRSALHREGVDHATLRRFLGRVISARPVEALRQRIGAIVDELIEPARQSGRLEVVADLALPLPLAVACELVGVPAPDRALVQTWGLEVVKAFTMVLPQEQRPAVDGAVRELRAYFAGTVPAQLAPALAEVDGAAGRDSLLDNVVFLFVSGFTTTVHLIASACATLLAYPDEWERLRQDRALIEPAIEECLRYDAPIQHVSRLVAQRVEVEGVTLRPGRMVHLLIGAANRDDDEFPEPDRFDAARAPNPHLSFGGGPHFCLGANLGRLEAAVLVERLLSTCARVELAGPAIRRPMQVFRSYERVPVALTAS
jgi:cytochrome P450